MEMQRPKFEKQSFMPDNTPSLICVQYYTAKKVARATIIVSDFAKVIKSLRRCVRAISPLARPRSRGQPLGWQWGSNPRMVCAQPKKDSDTLARAAVFFCSRNRIRQFRLRTQNQITTQQSGCDLERRSDGVNER